VPSSDLASTYRNLETLERHGVVRHVHLGHGPGRYALSGAGEREYLVCERCGALRAVRPAELDAIREHIRVTFGYVTRFSHFPLVGRCSTCAAADDAQLPSEGGHAHS
jgi:Fur family ferric uptake transcriptional regulator